MNLKIKVLDRAAMGRDTPLEVLEAFGDVTIYDATTADDIVEKIADADVLVLNKVKIDKYALSHCKSLKLICVFATGYDQIDVAAARERGVAVCNVPAYSTESVTLFTVATVLALATRLGEYSDFVRSGSYTLSGVPNKLEPVYHEISGKTWGIVGYGNIGSSVAKVARALGARVLINKRTPVHGLDCVELEALCESSDIITIHCPLNNETRGMISKKQISKMKKDVILVNEARGAVLNENDVAEAILDGKIGAFGSDVYSEEPFGISHPFYRIKDFNNVILTPHAAWGSYEARMRCINIVAENIKSFFSGDVKNRVDA